MIASSKGKVSYEKSCEQDNEVAHTGLRIGSSTFVGEGIGLGSTEELRTTCYTIIVVDSGMAIPACNYPSQDKVGEARFYELLK